MFDAQRAAEVVTTALHIIGGVSSAVEHIINGDISGSLKVALAVGACILIIAVSAALAELIRIKVHRYVQKHKPRNKEGPYQ